LLVLLLRVHRLNGILIRPWTSVLKVPMVSLWVQSRDHTPRYAAKLCCKTDCKTVVETVRKAVRTTVPELIPRPSCVENQGNHRIAPDKFRERSAGRIEPSQEIILKIICQNARNFPQDTPQSCLRSKNNDCSLILSEEHISLYLVNFIPPRSVIRGAAVSRIPIIAPYL